MRERMSGVVVIVACRPKSGKESELLTLVRSRVPALRAEGLATDRVPTIVRAAHATIIEVSEWKSREAVEAAHKNPNVRAMWEKFFALCDCVPLNTMAEAGRDVRRLHTAQLTMQMADWKKALIGQWRGTKQLFLEPPPAAAAASPSELSVAAVAGGNFFEFTYDWAYEGEEQTGVLLFGFDEQNAASGAWVDSFHMSSKIFVCTGAAQDHSAKLRGSYEAPPGPDWGWSIAIRSVSTDELQVVMHNISPEGEEELAVQIDYSRRV